LDFGEDLVGLSRPLKGFWMSVVVGDVIVERFDELGDALENASADAVVCEISEPSFDQV
jgi:hypothetical protein